jgi:hypothetical protein
LDNLQPEPTHVFGPSHPISGPKEIIMDVPYISRFRDDAGGATGGGAEVLIVNELKSATCIYVLLQLAAQAILVLYKRWTDAGRPASNRNFKVPVPIMVLVYCGPDDLPSDTLDFQDIFEHIPEPLRPFVMQFRLFVVNLRRFDYDNLPGRPDTQAVVEAMKRSTDGTLAAHLGSVVGRMEALPIDDRIMEIIHDITWLGGRVAGVQPDQIVQVITNIIKGPKGVEMAETIQKGIFQEGVEVGETRGELKARINDILRILRANFGAVPDEIITELNSRTDPTALESLVVLAAQCKSLDVFADALR